MVDILGEIRESCRIVGKPQLVINFSLKSEYLYLLTISPQTMFNIFRNHSPLSEMSDFYNTKKSVREALSNIQHQLIGCFSSKTKVDQYLKILLSQIQANPNKLQAGRPFYFLKIAMITHRIVLTVDNCSHHHLLKHGFISFVETLLSEILRSIARNKQVLGKEFAYINQTLTIPYVQYQQKKLLLLEANISLNNQQKFQTKSKQPSLSQRPVLDPQSCPQHLEIYVPSSCTLQLSMTQMLGLHYQKCYKYLNLLNKGLVLSKKLITIYRYYFHNYLFLADFNLLLAIDFSALYNSIGELFLCIRKLEKQMDIESIEYLELSKEIGQANQGMFLIMLNRYCSRDVGHLIINWIQLQNPQAQDIKQAKQNNESPKQKQDVRMKRSKTICDSTISLQTQPDTPEIKKYQDELTARQTKQKLDILNQLRQSFKKKFKNESELAEKVQKVKKNRSFFQQKKPQKLIY